MIIITVIILMLHSCACGFMGPGCWLLHLFGGLSDTTTLFNDTVSLFI